MKSVIGIVAALLVAIICPAAAFAVLVIIGGCWLAAELLSRISLRGVGRVGQGLLAVAIAAVVGGVALGLVGAGLAVLVVVLGLAGIYD